MRIKNVLLSSLLLAGAIGQTALAAPTVDVTLTTGVSANLKPRNTLDSVPVGAGGFTVFMQWHDLPVRTKWMFFTEADPITYTTHIFDGHGKEVSTDTHTFTPEKAEDVSWARHDFKEGEVLGLWKIRLDVFGESVEKSLKVE